MITKIAARHVTHSIYFGEFPLSFAASIGSCEYILRLAEAGADLDAQAITLTLSP